MDRVGRKTEISLQNVLYCFLVILLHCLSEAVTTLERGSWQYGLALVPWRLAAAAVYGFVFLSGVKLFLPGHESRSLKRFYLGRCRRILLPYLLATAVYLLTKWATGDRLSLPQLLRCVLLGDTATHLYFVIIILQFYLLMPLWRALVQRVSPWISLGAALFLSLGFRQCLGLILPQEGGWFWQYQDRFFMTYLFFWLLGCYTGTQYEAFLDLLRQNRRAILLCFLLFTLMDQGCTWLTYVWGVYIPLLDFIGDAYLVFAILTCAVLTQGVSDGACLGRVDRASYLIYLYHLLVLLAVDLGMDRLGLSSVGLRFVVRLLLVLGGTVLGCILWQSLVEQGKLRQKTWDS